MVNRSVKGNGEEWQGTGYAQPGHGEVLDGGGENLIFGQAEEVTKFCYAAAKFTARVGGEYLGLVLSLLCICPTRKKSQPTLRRKFHRVLVQKHLVCHGLLLERFADGLKHREVGARDNKSIRRKEFSPQGSAHLQLTKFFYELFLRLDRNGIWRPLVQAG